MSLGCGLFASPAKMFACDIFGRFAKGLASQFSSARFKTSELPSSLGFSGEGESSLKQKQIETS